MPLNPALAGIGLAGNAVRVYVLEDRVDGLEIPERFGELRTEVVSTPGFQTLTPCGVSVGHVAVTAGTLGCLVDVGGRRHLLSNNHVLANSNAALNGDEVVQPGPTDGGVAPGDVIASLNAFEPIDFTGAVNHIDAALAELVDPAQVTPDIITIGFPVNPPKQASLGQSVAKHGRTTNFTTGAVVDVSFDGYVSYNGAGTAWFEDQVVVRGFDGPFSQPGDSGSLILEDATSHPVALLFAGDQRLTLANPIDAVLNRFGASIVTR